MSSENSANCYFIWGVDEAAYGPVPLETLLEWIADERVLPDTWVFARKENAWARAGSLTELQAAFRPDADIPTPQKGFKPGSLRRIKILAELNDAQLAHLAEFLQLENVRQHHQLCKEGDPGDAMYLILGGELRVRSLAGDRETILATLAIGDFFGEMALFDHGPRSADVVANTDSTLLRLSAEAFKRLTREAPGLATPFLEATSRTLAARIRADNKRLARISQQFSASGGR